MLVVISIGIIVLGHGIGYVIDETLKEHIRYLQTCTEGLENLSTGDYVFCHQYDISMRTTK